MRRHFAVLLFLLAGIPARGQNPFEPDTHIDCVERLRIPDFPAEARQGGAEGTITATVTLSSRASVQLIATEFQTKKPKTIGILIPPVEDAIRQAAFRPRCAGKTIELVFDFALAGSASELPAQTVYFGYPNKFRIVAAPAKPPPRSK